MVVTHHAKDRLEERCNLKPKSVRRMAERAFDRGLAHRDLTGRLCKWVDGLYLKYNQGNQIRIYGHNAYIFHNYVLITVIPVPKNLYDLEKSAKDRKNAAKACNHRPTP